MSTAIVSVRRGHVCYCSYLTFLAYSVKWDLEVHWVCCNKNALQWRSHTNDYKFRWGNHSLHTVGQYGSGQARMDCSICWECT